MAPEFVNVIGEFQWAQQKLVPDLLDSDNNPKLLSQKQQPTNLLL